MPELIATPRDLAELTYAELTRREGVSPEVATLANLFETMFFASLWTEEGQAITFDITYLDPANPDPDPPEQPPADRWRLVPLKRPLPLTIRNLVKIAMASDPRTSSFAVHHEEDGRLYAWAMIDQGNRYHDFIHYDSESGPERPGVFQAAAVGLGWLNVRVDYEVLGELRIHELKQQLGDPLRKGALRRALQPGVDSFLESVQSASGNDYHRRDHWDLSFAATWTEAVARVLLRIRGLGHGGSVLMTPDQSFDGLDVKYEVTYDRLADALRRWAIATVEETNASDVIHEDYFETDSSIIPIDLYLDEAVARNDLEDIDSEIDGAIWFISLLSRVDGLVLMGRDLSVHGFGAVITIEIEPEKVHAAGDDDASDDDLTELDYTAFGTRHRSMMRYCQAVPGAVGFVVSQDGDIRGMTQVRDRLVVFDGLQLQRAFSRDEDEKVDVDYSGEPHAP